jgi:hypothetical protein
MNKLNFEIVKELFKEEYPGGNIYIKEKNTYYVIFKEGGEMYAYKAKNHLQLLQKLDIQAQVLYMREYRALAKEKEKIERELQFGYIPGNEDWGIKDYFLSSLEKEQRRKRLEEIEEIIKENYIF